MSESVLSVHNLHKSYRKNDISVDVLRGLDFEVPADSMTALVGRSGSGKSTLMHLMATLDQPDEGEIRFVGNRIDNAPRAVRDAYRNQSIGVIFQFYHLLPELSALENVLAPAMIDHSLWSYLSKRKQLRKRAEEMIEKVGLSHRASHRPTEMSGGEMQRAAIARALMNDPLVLLADEPTGNLDTETGGQILSLLRQLNQDDGLTVLMITHDDSIAASSDVCYRMENGRLKDEPIAKAAA